MRLTPVFAVVLSAVALAACGPSVAHEAGASAHNHAAAQTQEPGKYAPYSFLIGEWDIVPQPNSVGLTIRQTFRWGPAQGYIMADAYVHPNGAAEQLHYEGIMLWNEAHQNLDFLFMHEPGSYGQEQGIVRVDADGTIVREVTEYAGDGAVRHSRQTWSRTDENAGVMALLRQGADGSWRPAFPGSDAMTMTRRAS